MQDLSNDPDLNLVELVELLQHIDEHADRAKENEFVVYDKDGNKIIL